MTGHSIASVDPFINAVFDTLQSSFLVLPRGLDFVTYPEFQQAYEVLNVNVRYHVPAHQRSFDWDKDEIEDLWKENH